MCSIDWQDVSRRALAQLTEGERRSGALYLDERELAPGSVVKVDGKEVAIRRKTALAFVDREPQANWGHSSRYLLIDLESGEVESLEAQFPPFLRGVPATLRLAWKGETVPDWAIAKP